MTHQITIEGNAAIQDLEIENIQLRDDLEAAEKRFGNERQYAQEQRHNATSWRRMVNGDRSATDALELVRNILDEAAIEEDDENMSALRKMLWNESDTDKKLAGETCDLAWYEYEAAG